MAQGTKKLLKLLAEIDINQPYGTKLFDALARLTVSVAVEAVCLKETIDDKRGKTHREVYLIQRSLTDMAYPGQWHCPGSVMRPGESIEDVMKRLSEQEFSEKIISYRFIENFNYPAEERGHFFSLLHLCHLQESEGLKGKWFPIHQLPEKTIEQHRSMVIPRIACRYPPY